MEPRRRFLLGIVVSHGPNFGPWETRGCRRGRQDHVFVSHCCGWTAIRHYPGALRCFPALGNSFFPMPGALRAFSALGNCFFLLPGALRAFSALGNCFPLLSGALRVFFALAVAFPFCRGRVVEVGNDGTPQKIPVGHRCFPWGQFRPVGNTRLPQRPSGPCLCFPLLRTIFWWAVFGRRTIFWRTVFGWLTIFRWRTVSRRWEVFWWGRFPDGGRYSDGGQSPGWRVCFSRLMVFRWRASYSWWTIFWRAVFWRADSSGGGRDGIGRECV